MIEERLFSNYGWIIFAFVFIYLTDLLLRCAKNIFKSEIFATDNDGLELETFGSFESRVGTNVLEVCSNLKKAGNVTKIHGGMSDFIISSTFLYEFCSVPGNVFNSDIPKIELIQSPENNTARISMLYLTRVLLSIITKNTNQNSLNYHSILIKKYIRKLLAQHSTQLDNGMFEIENVFDYTQDIIKHISIITCFGKAAKSHKKLHGIIESHLSVPSTFSDYNLAFFKRLRAMVLHFKGKSHSKYLGFYVKNQLLNRLRSFKKLGAGKKDAIQLILEDKRFNLADFNLISYIIFGLVMSHCKLLAPRISNFIADMSLNAEAYSRLALEQQEIIQKFGNDITLSHLEKMKYLDAFLLESARLSDAPMLMRKVTQDFNLSNGAHFPKNSYLKFHGFIYNRDPVLFGDDPYSFRPERHLSNSTTLSEYSVKNIMWGLGPRVCPAREYSVVQLKLFAAIFIRKYEISQKERFASPGYKGYKFRDTLLHVVSKVYIRPHNILYYKSVFKNRSDIS